MPRTAGVSSVHRRTVQRATQAAHRGTMRLLGTDQALDERDFDFLLSHGLPQNLFDGLAALGSNFGRRAHRQQALIVARTML
jgi:hypothetical protein